MVAKLFIPIVIASLISSPVYVANGYYDFNWSPDGKRIVYNRGNNVHVIRLNGGQEKRLAAGDQAVWSPDGSKIAYASDQDKHLGIYLMDADGSNQTRLTPVRKGSWDGHPTWSPDGKRIAFSSYRDGNLEIYVMNSDGTKQENLTQNQEVDDHPLWSPDGKKIAFLRRRQNPYSNYRLYVTNPDGSNEKQLTQDGATWPTWSPGGRRIAFVGNFAGNSDIYVVDVDDGSTIQLTTAQEYDVSPAWSPDGQKIAFVSYRTGEVEIYLVDATGGKQYRLTEFHDTFLEIRGLKWSSDGKGLFFEGRRMRGSGIYMVHLYRDVTAQKAIAIGETIPE